MNHPSPRKAFTLVELLVVVAIIAVLASILIPVATMVRERARVTKTELRMQDLISVFKTTAEENRAPVGWYQQAAGLEGVIEFKGKDFRIADVNGRMTYWRDLDRQDYTHPKYSPSSPYGSRNIDSFTYGYLWHTAWRASNPVKQSGEWLTQTDYDSNPHLFAFPWPETDQIYATSLPPPPHPIQIHPSGDPITFPLVGQGAGELDAEGYQTTSLADLSPLKTVDLMDAAGVFERQGMDPALYYTDRGDNKVWNDAWGSPLIVAYGLFQPPISGYVGAPRLAHPHHIWGQGVERFDGWRVARARERYGYGRSLYLSFGSPGPRMPDQLPAGARVDDDPSTWTSTIWPTTWDEICESCDADEWTGSTFTSTDEREDWGAYRTDSRGGYRHTLSAPVEIRGF